MNDVRLRLLFAGTFAILALVAAAILELAGDGTPPWLVATVGAAVGYIFGHAQANGKRVINGK